MIKKKCRPYHRFRKIKTSKNFCVQHPSVLLLFMVLFSLDSFSQTNKNIKPSSPVSLGSDGRMVYAPDAKGNRVPDFSYAGYQGGDHAIPDAQAVVYLPAIKR